MSHLIHEFFISIFWRDTKIKGAQTQSYQNVANLRLYLQSLNEQKKSLPRLQSRGVKTYGKFAQNIKGKKQINKNIDDKTTENEEIDAKDSKTSKSTERLQNQSKSDQ